MSTKLLNLTALLILSLTFLFQTIQAENKEGNHLIKISLQKRISGDSVKGTSSFVRETQDWNPQETAIIICDMWNQHWCKGATRRVAEMAPIMNKVLVLARLKGVLIVHAPSDCINYYKNHPARKTVQNLKSKNAEKLVSEDKLPPEKDAVWPIDQSDGGCDCFPACKEGRTWTHEIDDLKILSSDAISDSGVEISALFDQKNIKNVILMGVHTNMCVIGRSFGLRNMVRLGMNVVLMRDLTDTMYNSRQWPEVSHFAGNSLVVEYIERYVCPTMVSSDFTGKRQFRFKADKPSRITSIPSEN